MLGDNFAARPNSGRAGDGALESDDPCRMWLGGLPPRTTEYAVIQLTRQFGKLSDFRFPVHRAGENQGSTVGYCFVSYANPEDAQRALLALDGVNFHGHRLIARRAHPTRDELSLAQRSEEEAARLRITEQAKWCEAKLASCLADPPEAVRDADARAKAVLLRLTGDEPDTRTTPGVDDNRSRESSSFSVSFNSSVSRSDPPAPVIPDLYGRLGRLDPMRAHSAASVSSSSAAGMGMKRGGNIAGLGPKRPMETKQAIRRIEMALRQLEQTPVGGSDMLRPICTNRRPLIPPGIMANSTGESRGSMRGHSNAPGSRGGGYPPRRRFDRRDRARF